METVLTSGRMTPLNIEYWRLCPINTALLGLGRGGLGARRGYWDQGEGSETTCVVEDSVAVGNEAETDF